MIFEFISENNRSIIRAHIEKEAEKHGFQAEGSNPAMILKRSEVIFEKGIQSIHPDLLGLLCMLSFYPFVKDEVTFPMPVSKHFEKAFSREILPLYEVTGGKYQPTRGINIRNVDPTLEKYKGSKLALSFGGGTDSMAVHALFPEAIVIHEQSKLPFGFKLPDKTSSILKKKLQTSSYSFSNTGRMGIAKPYGWVTWASCTSNAILLATDLDIGYIMTGSILAAIILENGKKFRKPGLSRWNQAFNEIGIPLFSPVWSMTEAGTMLVCHKAGLLELTVSCQAHHGSECHTCFKCFRKDTLLNALKIKEFKDSYWERYKSPQIINALNNRPIYMGHIFRFTLPHLYHLDWINQCVDDLPPTDTWITGYYEPAFSMMPEELRNDIKERIGKFILPMLNTLDLEKWEQTKYHYKPVKQTNSWIKKMRRMFM